MGAQPGSGAAAAEEDQTAQAGQNAGGGFRCQSRIRRKTQITGGTEGEGSHILAASENGISGVVSRGEISSGRRTDEAVKIQSGQRSGELGVRTGADAEVRRYRRRHVIGVIIDGGRRNPGSTVSGPIFRKAIHGRGIVLQPESQSIAIGGAEIEGSSRTRLSTGK